MVDKLLGKTVSQVLEAIPDLGESTIEYGEDDDGRNSLRIKTPKRLRLETDEQGTDEVPPEVLLNSPLIALNSTLLGNSADIQMTKDGITLSSAYGRAGNTIGTATLKIEPRMVDSNEPTISLEADNGDVKLKGTNILFDGNVDFTNTNITGLPNIEQFKTRLTTIFQTTPTPFSAEDTELFAYLLLTMNTTPITQVIFNVKGEEGIDYVGFLVNAYSDMEANTLNLVYKSPMYALYLSYNASTQGFSGYFGLSEDIVETVDVALTTVFTETPQSLSTEEAQILRGGLSNILSVKNISFIIEAEESDVKTAFLQDVRFTGGNNAEITYLSSFWTLKLNADLLTGVITGYIISNTPPTSLDLGNADIGWNSEEERFEIISPTSYIKSDGANLLLDGTKVNLVGGQGYAYLDLTPEYAELCSEHKENGGFSNIVLSDGAININANNGAKFNGKVDFTNVTEILGLPSNSEITELTTQEVRIAELDDGIYKWTYAGKKILHYYGLTNTNVPANFNEGETFVFVYGSRTLADNEQFVKYYMVLGSMFVSSDTSKAAASLNYGYSTARGGSYASRAVSYIPTTEAMTLLGTQTVTGNKTFTGAVDFTNATVTGLPTSGGNNFELTAEAINSALDGQQLQVGGLGIQSNGITFMAGKINEKHDEDMPYIRADSGMGGYLDVKSDGAYFNNTKLATVNDVGSGGLDLGDADISYDNVDGLLSITNPNNTHISANKLEMYANQSDSSSIEILVGENDETYAYFSTSELTFTANQGPIGFKAGGDNGNITFSADKNITFEGTVDFRNATVTGLPSGGGSGETGGSVDTSKFLTTDTEQTIDSTKTIASDCSLKFQNAGAIYNESGTLTIENNDNKSIHVVAGGNHLSLETDGINIITPSTLQILSNDGTAVTVSPEQIYLMSEGDWCSVYITKETLGLWNENEESGKCTSLHMSNGVVEIFGDDKMYLRPYGGLEIFDTAQEEPAAKINADEISFQTTGKINLKSQWDLTIGSIDGDVCFDGGVSFSEAIVSGLSGLIKKDTVVNRQSLFWLLEAFWKDILEIKIYGLETSPLIFGKHSVTLNENEMPTQATFSTSSTFSEGGNVIIQHRTCVLNSNNIVEYFNKLTFNSDGTFSVNENHENIITDEMWEQNDIKVEVIYFYYKYDTV